MGSNTLLVYSHFVLKFKSSFDQKDIDVGITNRSIAQQPFKQFIEFQAKNRMSAKCVKKVSPAANNWRSTPAPTQVKNRIPAKYAANPSDTITSSSSTKWPTTAKRYTSALSAMTLSTPRNPWRRTSKATPKTSQLLQLPLSPTSPAAPAWKRRLEKYRFQNRKLRQLTTIRTSDIICILGIGIIWRMITAYQLQLV